MKSADRLQLWAAELFRVLLPVQEKPGTPVLLACDDETIRTVADRLCFEFDDASIQFGRDVAVAFHVGKTQGWKTVVAGDWERVARPRPLPNFLPVLCLWVLAASRMAHDDKHPTMEYHGRLCHLLGINYESALPCFNFIGSRFLDLADWLEHDLEGRHGHLLVPANPHPEHVGYAVAQTVFRLRDRQVLSVFFSTRLRGSLDGFDPLRRLQRWSGRGQLTRHALKVLNDPQFAEQTRAAIRVAFASWDGAELVETGGGGVGRLWPACIRLRPQPTPRLQFGAGNSKPIVFTLEGDGLTFAPDAEAELPWTLFTRLETASLVCGEPRSAAGGIRLPRLGETVIFENCDEGLLRVEEPSEETVWVLSHDEGLQKQLERHRFNDGDVLPAGWELLFNVPVEGLPGVARAAIAAPQQTPLRIDGGLPLGRPRYLSGYPPFLVAGDLETDAYLPVAVNGSECGRISSGGKLALPDTTGRYELEVGDGEYRQSYDIEERGEPKADLLWHDLAGEHALRRGARPENGGGARVCGAMLEPRTTGVLPFLTQVPCDVETICANGALVAHTRPATPAWFKEVGLDGRGRWWELLCEEPLVWALMPPAGGQPRVRLLADFELAQLKPDAAERVLALGVQVQTLRGVLGLEETRGRWCSLLELAQVTAQGGPPA